MSKNIAVWSKDTIEYKRLELFKSMLDVIIVENNFPIAITIQTTYFDIGQSWLWTTIIVTKLNSKSCIDSYQLLYPENHEKVIWGDMHDILEVAQEIKNEWLKTYKED